MNFLLNFLIITCLTTTSSTAMELNISKRETPNILTKVTCVEEPFHALYLAENRMLINGRKQCSIVNPTTNQELKRIADNGYWKSSIAVHPNKTKFAFCGYYSPGDIDNAEQKIMIYNAHTYELEHTKNWDHASIRNVFFSPLDDTIAIVEVSNPDVSLYNYKTNEAVIITIPEAAIEHQQEYEPIVCFDPTQQLLILAWNHVYIYNLTTAQKKSTGHSNSCHSFFEYSSNGLFCVKGTRYTVVLDKKIDNQPLPFFRDRTVISKHNQTSSFCQVAIHPNNTIFMTLSRATDHILTSHYFLEYRDSETSDPITTMSIALKGYQEDSSLSVSPHGKKLLITTDNECIELEVPFEVLYKGITKETFPYLLFLLKNYTSHCNDVEIPQDINHFIAKMLLETCKR